MELNNVNWILTRMYSSSQFQKSFHNGWKNYEIDETNVNYCFSMQFEFIYVLFWHS